MPTSVLRLPGMAALVVMTTLGFTGFALLMPLVPLWAARGGADAAQSGLVNGVLLLATVLTQGAVPGALRRFGWGPVLAVGLVLLGAPAPLIGLTSDLPALLACSAVRGIGFGVLTVCGGAAVAELVEPARRGAAVGAYGLAIALPNVLVLPLGPWLADRLGAPATFALGAAPILGVPAALVLARAVEAAIRAHRHREAEGGVDHPHAASTTGAALRRLVVPSLLLFSITLPGGGVLTFAPQMIADSGLVTAVLFVLGLVAAWSRWYAGRLADAHGARRFVRPLALVGAAGLAAIGVSLTGENTPLLLAGAALLGTAYGALQNLTLVLAFEAVPQRQVGVASAVWNVGFDAGTGLGSLALGAVAATAGFPAAMYAAALCCAAGLPLAAGLRRRRGE